uniref:NADH-ubiquinone oxidoreductase chain 2 n=1 Tax=Bolbometopon muricatum TaxID=188110 RepID=A0A1P8LFY4_BOLMU|nr:NADH dehydrogenase subunit 2 [Bolbometopon muricatum]APW83528.1 NADH dehydrogenase subunit 2 [Bolbometopon muricatum]
MSPLILSIFLFALGLGTTITFASSHWLTAWMGLEINTLAILPLMAKQHHPRAVEATAKYFLAQATAATALLFASTTNAWFSGQWEINQMSHPIPIAMLTIAIAFKVGLAPVHSWLPDVLQGVDLTTGLILSSWQKLAPIILLIQVQPHHSTALILLGFASTVVGGWGGLNQTQLRKLLAYSSIAHMGWVTIVLHFSPALSFLVLMIYFTMTFATFLAFKLNKATTLNALAISWSKSPTLTALTPLILLSLGGLPPLTGFMSKWLVIQELTKQDLPLVATLIALTALLSLYFYLRLSYAMTLTMSPNNPAGITPWRLCSLQTTLPLALSMMGTLLLLPLTPSITSLLSF